VLQFAIVVLMNTVTDLLVILSIRMTHECNNMLGNVGYCRKFDKEGKSCRPLSTAAILNLDFPDEWKWYH
jgi:hypothetical protein